MFGSRGHDTHVPVCHRVPVSRPPKPAQSIRGDAARAGWLTPSAILLLVANAVPLIGVVVMGWSTFAIIFLYWLENVIVAGFTLFRMVLARSGTDKARHIVYFVIFHWIVLNVHGAIVFAAFGGYEQQMLEGDWLIPGPTMLTQIVLDHGLQLAALALVISHGFSFVWNYVGGGEYQHTTAADVWMVMFIRVMVLSAGVLSGAVIVDVLGSPLFAIVPLIAIKALVDLCGHVLEHRRLSAGNPQPAAAQ